MDERTTGGENAVSAAYSARNAPVAPKRTQAFRRNSSENAAAVIALERAIALDPQRKRYRKLMRTYRREMRLHAAIRAKSVAGRWAVRLVRALSNTRRSSPALDQDADRGRGEA